MTLIIIIVSLAAERFLGSLEDYRNFTWFNRYAGWLLGKTSEEGLLNGWAGVVLLVGSVSIAAAYVGHELSDWFGLAGFLFALVVFLYCLGPRTFYEQLKAFCDLASNKQTDSAIWYAEEMLARGLSQGEKDALARTMTESLLVLVHRRIFAVIFWFVILGPFGAVLYRLTSVLLEYVKSYSNSEFAAFTEAVKKLHYVLGWIPSRLLSLSYVLTGNFVDGMSAFKSGGSVFSNRWFDENEQVLVSSGTGALNIEQKDNADVELGAVSGALGLVRRSVVLWLGIIALMTLSGLVG
jgi:membrane protein required for beta-lactamase induction